MDKTSDGEVMSSNSAGYLNGVLSYHFLNVGYCLKRPKTIEKESEMPSSSSSGANLCDG